MVVVWLFDAYHCLKYRIIITLRIDSTRLALSPHFDSIALPDRLGFFS